MAEYAECIREFGSEYKTVDFNMKGRIVWKI